jgi:predicted dehydrogenase
MPATTIAMVGFGRWAAHIFRDLTTLGCRVAVAVPSETGRRRAREAGAAVAVSSIEELPPVDGVVVVTPTATHAEVVERVLEHLDVPVYVEKPLTDDVPAARRIARSAPARVFVMDKWRYHPGVEALRDLAGSGRLGRLVGLRSTRLQWGNQHGDVDGTWILAPHDLSIVLEILGRIPEPRLAFGDGDGREIDLVAVLGDEPWVRIEVSTRFPERRRELQVHLEGGVAWLPDSYADHVAVLLADGTAERIPISTELPLLRELRAFVEHVRGGPPPRSSAEEGAAVVEAIARLRSLAGLDGR